MNNTGTDPKTMAIVRLVAMTISWVSLLLTSQFGWEPFPFTDEQVNMGITLVLTIGTSIWSWYKNNPVTHYGVTKEEKGIAKVGTRQEFKENKKEDNQ